MARDIEALVAGLTLEEKASLTAGGTAWSTRPVERLGIPSVVMTDGPAGARGPFVPGVGEQVSALNIPCGSALGATWNPGLLEELGAALGEEARTKTARILLAPTVNIHRSPLGGRNFECYSEDPLLSGKAAAAFIRGVQSQGVATTVKHFAGNDAEFERFTIDSVIDQRTLREITLLPFELAVTEGGTLGIMTAYNRLNGRYCAEHRELLHDILREEWGFEGFVVTDWYAGGSTEGCVAAGLDLQMPAPDRFYGAALATAVREGRVPEPELDRIVHRMLGVFDRLGALDDEPRQPVAIDKPEHRALAHRAAVESMVLLRNEGGLLPLAPSALRTVAVIGPNAEVARTLGGGSAEVQPHHTTAPLVALAEAFGPGVELRHARGCTIDKRIPPLASTRTRSADGGVGFSMELFEGVEFAGEPVARTRRPDGRLVVVSGQDRDLPAVPFSARSTATLQVEESGRYRLSLVQVSPTRVLLDGRTVLDGIVDPPPRGEAFFNMGSAEVTATVELDAGREYRVEVESLCTERAWAHGAQVGCAAEEAPDELDRAVALAAASDVAIVVVGTNDDWESEGYDRTTMDLPGRQDELVERVLAANPRTVVVVNTGAPVTMDWAERVPAVLQVWFGGQEMAGALADVLVGAADPGGRLPTTIPVRLEDNPAYLNFPGEHGQLRYGEGIFVGYRWYDARRIAPRFAFGHGLSYTDFRLETPVLSSAAFGAGDELEVAVGVVNTGDRAGYEVVQLYVGSPESTALRPPKELKAYAKVWLEAGGRTTVRLRLGDRAFSYWHPGTAYESQQRASFLGRMTELEAVAPGWRTDPGRYELHIGRSSDDIAFVVPVEVG